MPSGLFDRCVSLRRDLHAHPELSFQEERSAAAVELALRAEGIEPLGRAVRTGVIADVVGEADGPLVVLRADLDALPLPERTELPFRSTVDGVMHACGHDAHTAMLLGAGAMLRRNPPNGRVRLLFQPAEERGNGAAHVCKEGWIDGASGVFGVHVDPFFDVGRIVAQAGPMNAASLSFFVTVHGQGGHGGKPHEGIDAALVAAHIVVALQSIASREVHPGRPVVVTVGKIVAGTGHNVLAAEAKLDGTVRCFDVAVQEQVRAAIERISRSVAESFRARAELRFGEGCPPVVNPPAGAALARLAVVDVLGEPGLAALPDPNMGAEDFSFYLRQCGGAYVRIGASPADRTPAPTHSPQFELDERCIAVGARYLDAVARRAIAAAALVQP